MDLINKIHVKSVGTRPRGPEAPGYSIGLHSEIEYICIPAFPKKENSCFCLESNFVLILSKMANKNNYATGTYTHHYSIHTIFDRAGFVLLRVACTCLMLILEKWVTRSV